MRILLTNDDGIDSPGLHALVHALSPTHQMTVVAPDRERSAVSHGLTIREPLFARPVDLKGLTAYAVSGTPADCVKLGIDQLVEEAVPDLIVSGINNGPNTGINVFYSGTVAAAMEATFVNIPAIAVSIASFTPRTYSVAAGITAVLVERFDVSVFHGSLVMNVNIPDCPADCIRGMRITRQGRIRYKDHYVRRVSPGGFPYYWLDGDHPDKVCDIDVDQGAIEENWVSITPLTADFNAGETRVQEVERWLEISDLRTEFSLQR
ncbi:5'/3'-nucleotidase SurE [bacterium]|nr:5'/3'-nucleotidase SurE [candidate division CSSED10-310 bacterium]